MAHVEDAASFLRDIVGPSAGAGSSAGGPALDDMSDEDRRQLVVKAKEKACAADERETSCDQKQELRVRPVAPAASSLMLNSCSKVMFYSQARISCMHVIDNRHRSVTNHSHRLSHGIVSAVHGSFTVIVLVTDSVIDLRAHRSQITVIAYR